MRKYDIKILILKIKGDTMKDATDLIGIFSEKDLSSRITKCNNVFLRYAGVKSRGDVINKTDKDFPWAEYSEYYMAHELDVISGNNYSLIMPFKDHRQQEFLFLHTKIQKLDENNQCIGILCHAVEIVSADIHKLVDMLNNNKCRSKNYSVGTRKSSFNFSKRQEEVLFYLIRGKSAKSIAKAMKISPRTVEYYVDILKIKCMCKSKNELIEFAFDNGFADFVPKTDNVMELIEKIKT